MKGKTNRKTNRGNNQETGRTDMDRNMNRTIMTILTVALAAVLLMIAGCGGKDLSTQAEVKDKPYSEALEKRLAAEMANETQTGSKRPDYLPAAMFSRLPEFPDDFYEVRTLVRLGRITDLENLEPEYWMQPEFFPKFEEIGLGILQDPPEGRWGAYGISTYPADSVSTIVKGDSVELYFFIKSSYLVETYQGVKFYVKYPDRADVTSGVEMQDGAKSVKQDPEEVKEYFDVKVDPNPFILEPNFPIYNVGGTKKIKVTISVAEDAPIGNYVVALDTGAVPEEYETMWIEKYLTLYTSGGMTKIERPYYQAFVSVIEGI